MAVSDLLATYLHDHAAGSEFAADLLRTLHKKHEDEPLGLFAQTLLFEIEQDRAVLNTIIERVGAASPDLKQAAAWSIERLSHVKLCMASTGLGSLEALETLSLGVWGKRGLWSALEAIADTDERLHGTNFRQLIKRAEAQYAQLEESRLQLARDTLRAAA